MSRRIARHDRGDRSSRCCSWGWSPPMLQQAARNLALPLSDASIIREQAAEKRLDPALIAAVIYAETKFDPRPSSAGAQGLMQILPGHRLLPGAALRGQQLHRQRPGNPEHQRGLRQLLPALPARPLRRQRDARGGGLQRRPGATSTGGSRRPMPPAGSSRCSEIPFPRDARIRAARARRPARLPRHVPAPARADCSAGASYGRAAYARLQARLRLHAHRRPAEGDRGAGRGRGGGRALPDAARRDRHGQDDDDGGRDRGGAAPGAGDRPQQDARGAAVQRVPHVLPGQRGRVLRLLLRLLPARGVRPQQGPVHREGLGDQPGGRSPAPRGHGGGVRAPGRDRGGVGVVHLRPGLAGDV